MLETKDILETINMIDNENLDVRTITMGISLLDCLDEDIDKACTKVYDKIMLNAKDLVKTGEDIEREYGIPIINKRISVTPIGMVAAPCQSKNVVRFAYALDKAAATRLWCRRALQAATTRLSRAFLRRLAKPTLSAPR